MSYKYTSRFQIRANVKQDDFAEGSLVSKASVLGELENLKVLLPDSAQILNNPDLLYTCFNAAVANLVNLNNDGITTAGAKRLAETCKLKPMNIEHYRSDIVGVITNYAFSSFLDNTVVGEEDLGNDPFNISLAAIVWKVANRGFAEFLEDTQKEGSYSYAEISASWEVGFDSYNIAVGSKDLRKAKIISDEKEKEAYDKHLLQNGGTGFLPTGEEVYRVIGDDCMFLGCAFTSNPAAPVKGILASDYKSLEMKAKEEGKKEIDPEILKIESKFSEQINQLAASIKTLETKNIHKNDIKTSEALKTRVIINMKYPNLDSLIDNIATASGPDVREFVQSQLEKANQALLDIRKDKEEKEKALTDALANIENSKDVTDQLQNEVNTLKANLKAQEDQAKFNERMESLSEQYELDAAAKKVITKNIVGLSDESFAAWLEDMKPLLKVKSQKQEDPNLEAAAKKPVNPPIPNSQGEGKDSKQSEWKNTLSKIKVTV